MYGAILGDMIGDSYSTMDGIMPVLEVIKKAADLGCSAVAITDHGTVQGFPDAQWASRQYSIKVICGMGDIIETMSTEIIL